MASTVRAIANAVVDALAHLGITSTGIPITAPDADRWGALVIITLISPDTIS